MYYLILAIFACDVSVSILFKFTKKYQIVTAQMIAFGYVVALSLSYFLLAPNFKGLTFTEFFVQSEAKPIFISLRICACRFFGDVESSGVWRYYSHRCCTTFGIVLANYRCSCDFR